MSEQGEIWQVEVDGQLYDTDLETLKQWILEGSVQPQDRVRRGRMTFIEAGRAPALRGAFAGEAPSPDTASHAESYPSEGPYGAGSAFAEPQRFDAPAAPYGAPAAPPVYAAGMHGGAGCANHPGVPPRYACTSCGAGFCRPCTKMVNNVPVCPLCGELCRPYEEATQRAQVAASLNAGFGLEDFVRAVTYPLNDKVGLLLACFLYGIVAMIPHVYARAFSLAIIFGCMSYIINRLSMGRLEGGVLPDFSDSLFDMLWVPVKLAVAIMLITVGPGFLLWLLIKPSVTDTVGFIASIGIAAVVGTLWALFYYPMALLVAGFTQSFIAVVNPIVGFDTMWRMGTTYVKAYFMCLAVGVPIFLTTLFISMLVNVGSADGRAVVQSGLVILVGKALAGAVSFYGAAVVAAILGLAIWKKSDALGLR